MFFGIQTFDFGKKIILVMVVLKDSKDSTIKLPSDKIQVSN